MLQTTIGLAIWISAIRPSADSAFCDFYDEDNKIKKRIFLSEKMRIFAHGI